MRSRRIGELEAELEQELEAELEEEEELDGEQHAQEHRRRRRTPPLSPYSAAPPPLLADIEPFFLSKCLCAAATALGRLQRSQDHRGGRKHKMRSTAETPPRR